MSNFGRMERGSLYSEDYRLYLTDHDSPISALHDVPLYANHVMSELHMIVEIPKWSNAKMEISKELQLNPIVQDVKKGQLRYVDNVFPHHGYMWNYGALPQTWEDPSHEDERTGAKGDDDPLDACEIGERIHQRGEVIKVKPLGLLGLIDEGETDWKIIVIDVEDPLANKLNSIEDVEEEMPGFLSSTRDWFRDYKVPQGRAANQFAFDGEFRGKEEAVEIINEAHRHWQSLIGDLAENTAMARENLTAAGSADTIDRSVAMEIVEKSAPEAGENDRVDPPAIGKWHFVRH